MSRLPAARKGSPLKIKDKPLSFSFWPVTRTTRRYGLQSHLYSTNPWALIAQSITKRCRSAARDEARACIAQAEFFFRSAVGTEDLASKPLPLYYSFMNVAKALALTAGIRASFDQARHGLADRIALGGKEWTDAFLEAHPQKVGKPPNVFDDFLCALGCPRLTTVLQLHVTALAPQLLPGHRIWCGAADERERFVPLQALPFLHSSGSKGIWALIQLRAEDLSRLELSRKQLLKEARALALFREVTREDAPADTITLELKEPVDYTGRPSDRVAELVRRIRPLLWATATTVDPYRHYYLYCAPSGQHPQVLPQLASIYAMAFYLGSITRYRPQHFRSILESPVGGFVQEVLASQPTQFLYLVASEFAARDVVRAPLV